MIGAKILARVELIGGSFCIESMNIPTGLEVERHRAALTRNELSRPMRLAIESGVLTLETSIFDYGCGLGGDIARLQESGYNCDGWDPYYRSNVPRMPADAVNLGYIINVIEDPIERDLVLADAWALTRRVLIVSAQILVNDMRGSLAYGDGVLTKRNTFQKYYTQAELKQYIDEVLTVDALPIALGVYLVFRDPAQAETFRLERLYSRLSSPRIRIASKKYEDYQTQLEPLVKFVTDRGRLPIKGELPQELELITEFGNLKRAFQIILTATDEAEWDAIAYRRSLDLQVYLALAQFGQHRIQANLSPAIKADIKAFFGNFEEACEVADRMLFKLGKPNIIRQLCQQSKIGKLLPNALYIHISALTELDPHLRLYEGCASRYFGGIDNVTLIKFNTEKSTISYLYYPDFDRDPHPALKWATIVDLTHLSVRCRDYSNSTNPPILHRQETFLSPHHPQFAEFHQLTAAEEAAGLYRDTSIIGNRQGWERVLQSHGLTVRDRRLEQIRSVES
jgi:DNA phosphorothioation-associated putative methyltransferase